MPRIAHFKPQELANTAWAFAALQVCNLPLLESIASAANRPMRERRDFKPPELSTMVWAFATLPYIHAPAHGYI